MFLADKYASVNQGKLGLKKKGAIEEKVQV